jgi:hypothetical protein
VNLVRRTSSNATLDASPAPSPLFGRKSYAEPALSAADADADAKATLLKQGSMHVMERTKVRCRAVFSFLCASLTWASPRRSRP